MRKLLWNKHNIKHIIMGEFDGRGAGTFGPSSFQQWAMQYQDLLLRKQSDGVVVHDQLHSEMVQEATKKSSNYTVH